MDATRESEVHRLEQERAAHASRYVYVSRFDIREGLRRRPHQLSRVDLDGGEDPDDEADQDRRVEDVPSRVSRFFG